MANTKRAGFKPALQLPVFFAPFAFFAAILLFGCGSGALGSLRLIFLMKISAARTGRLQLYSRLPEAFSYQMHYAVFRLQFTADAEKAHRFG